MSVKVSYGNRTFDTITEACRELGICPATLKKRLELAKQGQSAYVHGVPVAAYNPETEEKPTEGSRRCGPLLKNLCTHRLG